MKIIISLPKLKVKQTISPEIKHMFITDASIMLLLLITVLRLLSWVSQGI